MLRLLLELQQHDGQLQALQDQVRKVPLQIKQTKDAVSEMRKRLIREQQSLQENETFIQQQRDAIVALAAQLSRSKARSSQVRNTKEANAVQREADAARRSIEMREEEVSRLAGALAQEKERIATFEIKLQQDETDIGKQESQLQSKLSHIQTQATELEKERQVLLTHVSPDWLHRYESVRKRRWPVLVKASQSTCMGCNMTISPQSFVNLQRGDSIENCAQCQRILYLQVD